MVHNICHRPLGGGTRRRQTDRQTDRGWPPRREGRTERLTKPASSSCIPIVPSARPLARPLRPFPHPTHSSLNTRRQSTMSITPASTLTCFRMPCHRPPVIQPPRKFPAPRGNKRRFRRSLRTPGEFGKKKVLRLHGTSRVACVLLDSSRARCSCRTACLLRPLHRALPRVPRACIRLRATWHGHAAD